MDQEEYKFKRWTARIFDNIRTHRKLTQKEMADRLKTKQTAISRIECLNHLPSLEFLYKTAKTFDYDIKITLTAKDDGTRIDSDGIIVYGDRDLRDLLDQV